MIASLYARRATAKADRFRRSCASLLALCGGLISDESLSDKEILFLKKWLDDNDDIARTWPGDVLLARVNGALADRFIEETERKHLVNTLEALLDDTLEEDSQAVGVSDRLPLDEVISVTFAERTFCFVGQFIFGTHSACAAAVEKLGGETSPTISDAVDYLVVGTLIDGRNADSDDMKQIGEATALRESGADIRIIDESVWTHFLSES